MLTEYMKNLGYTSNQITKIITIYPLNKLKEETLLKKIEENYNFLSKYGYSNSEIIKITTKLPHICTYKPINLENKLNNLIKLGYTKEEAIKLTKNNPSILSYSICALVLLVYFCKKYNFTIKELFLPTKETFYGIKNMVKK